jgi:hypothetical protein
MCAHKRLFVFFLLLCQFFITPLFDEAGNVQYYLGVQKEVATKDTQQDGQNPGWRIFMWL